MRTLLVLLAVAMFGTPAFSKGIQARVTDLESRADETDAEQAVQDARLDAVLCQKSADPKRQ